MTSRPALPIERARTIITDGLPIGPWLAPCLCGAGKHAHGGKQGTGAAPSTGCSKYRADNAYELAWKALEAASRSLKKSLYAADRVERQRHYKATPREPGKWSIGASDTGTCPRKIQYRNLPPKDFEPDYEPQDEALMGKMIHDQVTAMMESIYPWREYKGKVLIPGLDRKSEFDSYDPVTGILEDYKTAGDYKWDTLGPDGPTDDTWGQVLLYGLAVAATGRQVSTLRLSYIHRAKGKNEDFEAPYDQARAEKWRDYLLSLAHMLDMLYLGVPGAEDLPKTEPGPSQSELCRRCFARSHCWNIPKAEAVGRSPEGYTELGAEPEDPTVAAAIAEKLRAAAERKQAEEEEERAKVLLKGITPGRYGPHGEFTIAEQAHGGGEDKAAYADTLTSLFDLDDAHRPPLALIPVPEKKRGSHPVYKRTRRALLDKEAKERLKETDQ